MESHFDKKTKIVATIGPNTSSKEMMEKILKAGVNVFRFNFSHGSHEEHQKAYDNARVIQKKLNIPLAIFQDLCGPKIRIGDFDTESVELKAGESFTLTTENIVGNHKKASINYKKITKEIHAGNIIFLNDGRQKLQVTKVTGDEVHTKIIIGGSIKGRRGVNIPGANLSISSLTEKDKKDVLWAIKNDVDFVAISFVRSADDILDLKKLLSKAKSRIRIIAKIETPEALENLDAILDACDGVMIARGDLAVEIPAEEVPIHQKNIIRKCNMLGKPVITATQMLNSMMTSTVPTRAEVNDIANAILDGTDAIMLSDETTVGKYPLEAVTTMANVAEHTEKFFAYEDILKKEHFSCTDATCSISLSTVSTGRDLNAKAIVALSVSGFTGRMIARYRPKRPVIVITYDIKTYNQLALSFNCYPILTQSFKELSNTIEKAKKIVLDNKIAKKNDIILIVAGIPFAKQGSTNMLLVQNL